MRSWFGRPLCEMEPSDADVYFGKVLRASPNGTWLGRSQAPTTYFLFPELRHKGEIHRMTGRVIECPMDEMGRPRGSKDAALRIAPTGPEDVDLGNCRLTIAGRVRPLDDLALKLLLDWVDHQRSRWRNTANLHLLINNRTANTSGRASNRWVLFADMTDRWIRPAL